MAIASRWGNVFPPNPRPRKSSAVVATALLLVCVGLVIAACGTDAKGIEACQRIERVRCESAPACARDNPDWGPNLDRPVHEGNEPKNDVASCIRFYDDQCLHGLVVESDPSPADVDACVNAIINGTCDVVKHPETDPACAFLIPPQPVTTAPADASEAEANASEASSADAATE